MAAIRNKQPFYSGGVPSFPLTPGPYHSRVEDQRVAFDGGLSGIDRPKNYQFVAFRPGFALQASELNEIQEHFQMQLTLSMSMMHNWITSGRGVLWNSYSENSWSEGGTNVDTSQPDTGIGVGGLVGDFGTTHDADYVISGPGWRGATPLYPFENPYPGPGGGEVGKLVDVSDSAPTTPDQGQITISFRSGWYLTEVRDVWGGEDSGPQNVSGMKHWVYLDTDQDLSNDSNYTITIDKSTSTVYGIGLITNSRYVGCQQDLSDDPYDPDLADNAAGVPNSAACGASRYEVFFDGSRASLATDTASKDKTSLCVKVDTQNREVRYMNNLLLYKWN